MASSYNGARRMDRDTTLNPEVMPASQYLQEKLQERRGSRHSNLRPKRGRQSDLGPFRNGGDDDIFFNEAQESRKGSVRAFDSSPLTAIPGREQQEGGVRRRAPGAKDLNEQMDRLTKQNFALKLELDHRREANVKLQQQLNEMRGQVERAEGLEMEHAELLRINSQLVEELEKRDKAVEEAMDIICDLEDQVTDVQERNSATRPSTANADSGYAGTETHEQVPPSSPPELIKHSKAPLVAHRQPPRAASAATTKLLGAVNGVTPARPRREPHILSQKKPSTHALRSVYLETAQALHSVQSFNSLLTKRESRNDDAEPILDSPRLSVLSESSFPSIYSPKAGLSPEKYTWEDDGADAAVPRESSVHLRQDSIKRVSQWMDDRDLVDETPSKSNRISPPMSQLSGLASSSHKRPVDTAQFQSLAKTLSNGSTATQISGPADGVSYIKPFPMSTDRHSQKKQERPTSFAGPMFGEPLLPPTPDSASTRMLRGSRSSLGDEERSLLDVTPMPVKGYDALEPEIRTAPKQFRSSMELRSAYDSLAQRTGGNAFNGYDDEDAGESVQDLGYDYNGFPDGSSLLMGTPSRFLSQPRAPYSINVIPKVPRRRQSSSEVTIGPRKPSMTRAETSPMGIPTHKTREERNYMASPPSQHSGSSNQTIIQASERQSTRSPDLTRVRPDLPHSKTSPPRSRTSPSPARAFTRRTQALFRRMSNSGRDSNTTTNNNNTYSEAREKSPLPTLTSTPSSAYVNDLPKEHRRPGTAQSGDYNSTQQQSISRSSTNTGRMRTTMGSPRRPMSASGERRNLFARRNSVKGAVEAMTPLTAVVDGEGAGGDVNGKVGVVGRRRGSFREVVGGVGRKPWR